MATPADMKIQAEVQTPLVETKTPPVSESSRGGPKSPTKTKGPSIKHKTRSQTESVRESEKSLQQLLEDFEGGKLNAFGNSDTLAKLTKIRKMQEELTLRHFEIDQMRISQENSGKDYKVEASLNELTQTLEKLGSEIQSLHS